MSQFWEHETCRECERLEVELEKATSALGTMIQSQHRIETENERQRAEIDRLRNILDHHEISDPLDPREAKQLG